MPLACLMVGMPRSRDTLYLGMFRQTHKLLSLLAILHFLPLLQLSIGRYTLVELTVSARILFQVPHETSNVHDGSWSFDGEVISISHYLTSTECTKLHG